MPSIKKILVIRFRQIGDAVLATALCNTLKASFPNAEIHFVLNKGIALLFENHPSIDKIITFDKNENKRFPKYVSKIWKLMHDEKYDVIIDMRSTVRTLFFSLFSLHTPFRVGCIKWYSKFLHNYHMDVYNQDLKIDMVERDLLYAAPLEKIRPIQYTNRFNIALTDKEKDDFRLYMEGEGINFKNPVILVGVTTKLSHKKWNTARMTEVIRKILSEYSTYQLVFNYAPGEEERAAQAIYDDMKAHENIFIKIKASSLRQLGALCANCSFYFGNEGGARHIAQALNVPSFAIYSPCSSKAIWLPCSSTVALGIESQDIASSDEIKNLNYEEKFSLITVEEVYKRLKPLLDKLQ